MLLHVAIERRLSASVDDFFISVFVELICAWSAV